MKMNMKTRKLIEYIIAKIKDLVSYFFYYFLVLYFVVIGLLLKTPGFNAEASAKLQFYVGMCFIFPFLLFFFIYIYADVLFRPLMYLSLCSMRFSVTVRRRRPMQL